MHILKLFTPLEKLESQLSELYKRFSDTYRFDAELSILFSRMSADEAAHADLVRFERRVVRGDPKRFNEVDADIEKLEEISSRVGVLLKSAEDLTVEKAIETAIALENNIAEQHYITAITLANTEVARLFDSLTSFDCRHFLAIEDFAKKRGFAFELDKTEYIKACRLSDVRQGETSDRVQAAPDPTVNIPQELIDRINSLYTWQNTDHYRLLEISDYATEIDIKEAYYRLAKELHPDRHTNMPGDLREKLDVIFSRINEAYSTLINSEKRSNYDRTVGLRRLAK